MKLADPGITTEPRGLAASQSRPADILIVAAVPGRSAALDVCVASSIAAAARGDAAQAAFDRKFSHHRNEIGESRQQGIHHRPLVWTADWRPHPAVTRTHRLLPEWAADVGEITSSQAETRNPNRSPAPEGSRGPRSPSESLSASRVALRRHH